MVHAPGYSDCVTAWETWPVQTGAWPSPDDADQDGTTATSDHEGSVTGEVEKEPSSNKDDSECIDYTSFIDKPIYFNEDLTKTRA